MTTLTRIGDFTLTWGESLRWDDRRDRLYLVDCATQKLHWLDGAEPPLHSMQLPSMAAGVVLTEGDQLVACLDDGLHVVDPDAGTTELLATYPEGHARARERRQRRRLRKPRDRNAQHGSRSGASWWFSATDGWRLLDDDIGNTNGPVVIDVDGQSTLVLGDTPAAAVYAYPYDGRAGTVGERRVFGDHRALGGMPDGATADAENGVWSCVLGTGKIARFTASGLDRTVDVPMANPSDVTFGGPDLDRMFVVSIALNLGESAEPAAEAGWVMAFEGLGVVGRPEARFRLASPHSGV